VVVGVRGGGGGGGVFVRVCVCVCVCVRVRVRVRVRGGGGGITDFTSGHIHNMAQHASTRTRACANIHMQVIGSSFERVSEES
jgi:hypothetical protein